MRGERHTVRRATPTHCAPRIHWPAVRRAHLRDAVNGGRVRQVLRNDCAALNVGNVKIGQRVAATHAPPILRNHLQSGKIHGARGSGGQGEGGPGRRTAGRPVG